jgi:putative pyruvate formate lyase activating enzyme
MRGHPSEPEHLASIMLDLQSMGCHNINLVSPSHVVPQILAAVLIAASAGLRLPLVYNTGGFDAQLSLRLLDSVVDIYMPDMKYADETTAHRFSGVRDYPAINQAAVAAMHRQVGDLVLDADGVATRGLLVRHLVLPGGLAGTDEVARFLAQQVSENTFINVMDQYRPCYQADRFPALSRRISPAEWRAAVAGVQRAGLRRLADRPAIRW